ncbi:MAG: hypothetical protein AAGI88_24040, partial [Pseudomonadota bacterium]
MSSATLVWRTLKLALVLGLFGCQESAPDFAAAPTQASVLPATTGDGWRSASLADQGIDPALVLEMLTQ